MIIEKANKIKAKYEKFGRDAFLILVMFFTGLIGFGLGYLAALNAQKTPVVMRNSVISIYEPIKEKVSVLGQKMPENGDFTVQTGEKAYVASKSGAKYHYPWCSGAQSIKEENKIWFSSIEEARAAGYEPAGNCKGLK